MSERLARAEEWIEGHEQRCDDRQKAMGREIGELKTALGGLTKGAWGAMIGLAAWALVQLYAQLQHPPQAQAVAVAGSVEHP